MTKDIEKIVNAALRYKACDAVSGIDNMEDAISTLLSPQGREFAMNTGYPNIETFRENIEVGSRIPGVFIDSGKALASNIDCVAVGDTDLTVSFSGTNKLYHVIAMHGANVYVDARKYAVVTVTEIGGNASITGDGTAAITIEKR